MSTVQAWPRRRYSPPPAANPHASPAQLMQAPAGILHSMLAAGPGLTHLGGVMVKGEAAEQHDIQHHARRPHVRLGAVVTRLAVARRQQLQGASMTGSTGGMAARRSAPVLGMQHLLCVHVLAVHMLALGLDLSARCPDPCTPPQLNSPCHTLCASPTTCCAGVVWAPSRQATKSLQCPGGAAMRVLPTPPPPNLHSLPPPLPTCGDMYTGVPMLLCMTPPSAVHFLANPKSHSLRHGVSLQSMSSVLSSFRSLWKGRGGDQQGLNSCGACKETRVTTAKLSRVLSRGGGHCQAQTTHPTTSHWSCPTTLCRSQRALHGATIWRASKQTPAAHLWATCCWCMYATASTNCRK